MADPRYNTAEHKRRTKVYADAIKAGEGWCVEPVCMIEREGGSRFIAPTTPRAGWHVPHNEDGLTYRDGPAHARCNTADGGRRRHNDERTRWIL